MKKIICVLAFSLLCSGCGVKTEITQSETAEMVSSIERTAKTVNSLSFETAADFTDVEKEKDNLKKQNLYSPLEASRTDDSYHMSGTIFLSDKRCLTEIEAVADTDITIKGTLTKTEGEIQLLYKDSSGTVSTLIDSKESTEQPITIDQVLNLKAGRGEIYFSGSAVYDFDIKLGLSDTITYYIN